jgi:DNA-binding response OmpR family regulator
MKKVLVIEDTESIKKALEIQLADDGYDVVLVGNGKDGLEKAKTFFAGCCYS